MADDSGMVASEDGESLVPDHDPNKAGTFTCPVLHVRTDADEDGDCSACGALIAGGRGVERSEAAALWHFQQAAFCPECEPQNPAARYADRCLEHRVRDALPAHYFDCDRFQVYGYGQRMGDCDCTATADFEALLAAQSQPRVVSTATDITAGQEGSS